MKRLLFALVLASCAPLKPRCVAVPARAMSLSSVRLVSLASDTDHVLTCDGTGTQGTDTFVSCASDSVDVLLALDGTVSDFRGVSVAVVTIDGARYRAESPEHVTITRGIPSPGVSRTFDVSGSFCDTEVDATVILNHLKIALPDGV